MASAPESEPLTSHFLPEGAFEQLSAGPGDVAAMASLADSYWSVIRALVAQVVSGLDGAGGDLSKAAAEGWALLSELDAERPEVVREVLTYPFVQASAMRCLSPAASADLEMDRAHLAGLAVVAALPAGMETELVLPVRDGPIYVPAVGAFAVDAGVRRTAVVRVSPTGLRLLHEGGEWRAVRRVTAAGISVTVEDLDPSVIAGRGRRRRG